MVRIGIIGCGGIARGVHIAQLKNISECAITAICDIDKDTLKAVGDELGLDEGSRYTDYHALIKSGKVDAVEICTPNHLHVPIACEVIRTGLPVNVEKPLSTDMAHASPILDALKESPVKNMMCFSYRYKSAVRYAKKLIEDGVLGDVISVDVSYCKESALWEGRRLEWRFVKEYAGTGVLGDLGVHLIDMAQFLTGRITKVCGMTDVIVKRRQKIGSDKWGDAETDDLCQFLARMENGATGSFYITRCAVGHANTIKYNVYGTKGAIMFDLDRPEILMLCRGVRGQFETLDVPDEYRAAQEQMFIDLLHGKDCEYLPTIEDGLYSQRILDAILLSSEKGEWVNI